MMTKLKVIFLIVFLSFNAQKVTSEESWVVNDIRISGLQRVSAGSVFNVMPIAIGDNVDVYESFKIQLKQYLKLASLMIFSLVEKEIL